jgi:hypothetical protein
LDRKTTLGIDPELRTLSKRIYEQACHVLYSAKFPFTSSIQQQKMESKLLSHSTKFNLLSHVGYILLMSASLESSLEIILAAAKDFVDLVKLDLHLADGNERMWDRLLAGTRSYWKN